MVATVLTIALLLAGGLAAAFSLYLLVLAVAATFYRGPAPGAAPSTRLVVLIPAHDEAALIARCVESLRAQAYPADLYEIVVIADNCADDTAAIAVAAGAHRVMIREAPNSRGKGQALRWAIDQILRWDPRPAAVVFVDADSVAAREMLTRLAQRFENGARVVQGLYLLSADGPESSALTRIAFMLVNRVRSAGLSVLRLPGTHLAGNGMLLAREILENNPWSAFTSTEDVEYSLMLYVAGEKITYAGDAALVADAPPTSEAAEGQQLRWHGGKAHLARAWIPRLVRRALADHRPSLLAVAFALALPPLGLLTAAVVACLAAAALASLIGLAPPWSMVPGAVALGSIVAFVLIGLRAGGASAADYRALAGAPLYIARMARRAPRVLSFRGDTWVRTARESSSE